MRGKSAKAAAVVANLYVRCWRHELAVVEAIERLALEGRNADAKACMTQFWRGKNGRDFFVDSVPGAFACVTWAEWAAAFLCDWAGRVVESKTISARVAI